MELYNKVTARLIVLRDTLHTYPIEVCRDTRRLTFEVESDFKGLRKDLAQLHHTIREAQMESLERMGFYLMRDQLTGASWLMVQIHPDGRFINSTVSGKLNHVTINLLKAK
jgi:hypothetical protein